MSKRHLSIFALAIVLGGGVFYAWKHKMAVAPALPEPVVIPLPNEEPVPSAEPIDTSNWKTYRNEEYGFEFKYPEGFFDLKEMFLSEPIGLYTAAIPRRFEIRLVEKGYSMDDYKHQIWLGFNILKSVKEYDSESEKGVVEVKVPFSSTQGKFYSRQEVQSERQSRYRLFVESGICDPETFTVIFDETEHPDGDVRNYVHVGCDGDEAGKVYQAVYNSIRFDSAIYNID